MYVMLLSGSVIVLAYVAAAAVIIPAISMIGFGKVPRFLRRGTDPTRGRTRMEGTGLLLIGAFILADALAADLGRRSAVRPGCRSDRHPLPGRAHRQYARQADRLNPAGPVG